MPETYELEINCAHCGGPMTVQFEDWVQERERLLSSAAACPYCAGSVTFDAPGRILWAIPRVVPHLLPH